MQDGRVARHKESLDSSARVAHFPQSNLKIAPLTMSSLVNTVFRGSRNYGLAAQATPPVRRRILTPKPIEN
jgi:hypothetical protein